MSRSNVEQGGVVEKEKQMRKQEKIRQIVEWLLVTSITSVLELGGAECDKYVIDQ